METDNEVNVFGKKANNLALIACITIIILSLGLLIFEKVDSVLESMNIIATLTIISLFLIYNNHKTLFKWSDVTTGYKLVLIYFSIRIFIILLGAPSTTEDARVLLGIVLPYPFSLLVYLFMLIVDVSILLILILQRYYKLVVGLISFLVVNQGLFILHMILIPVEKYLEGRSEEIVKLAIENPEIVTAAKMLTTGVLAIPFIILVIVLIYVYKHKEYFKD